MPSISSSMRMSWLYLQMRSVRDMEPVLIWPVSRPTTRSAMKAVLGLAGTVGNDGRVVGLLGHVDGLDGLGYGADLVDLDEDGVAGAHRYALLEALGVGNEEVVRR